MGFKCNPGVTITVLCCCMYQVAPGDDKNLLTPAGTNLQTSDATADHCPERYDVYTLKTQLQEDGTLVLSAQTNGEGLLEKFAVSDGIVESIKLGILERNMQASLRYLRVTDTSRPGFKLSYFFYCTIYSIEIMNGLKFETAGL